MNKIILIIFLFVNLFANEINKLRTEFYKNVVLKNIYKTYHDEKKIKKAIDYHTKVTFLYEKNMKKIAEIIARKIKEDNIKKDEYFSFIDLKQQTFIVILFKYDEKKIYFIGSDLISSGNMEREQEIRYGEDHYFDTPVGTYEVKKGWRSDGKYKPNQPDVQSYGSKGSFVYYFGKVKAKRYNTFDKNRTKILDKNKYEIYGDTLNFAIHSYNLNDNIYKRGFKSSHGCVRLSDELNQFLDKNLVLHENFFKNNKWNLRFAKKPKKIQNINIKGKYVFIIKNM